MNSSEKCFCIIPARGGSKSIPYKNIEPIAGRPLIDYCILAAESSNSVSRIICNTDSDKIAKHCDQFDIDVYTRPENLGEDDTDVKDVLVEMFLSMKSDKLLQTDDIAILLQPTSPFVTPQQIDSCVNLLREDKHLSSVQTIVKCPHNHHALNQRVVDDNGNVSFRYSEERIQAYNRQRKPNHYLFGNVIGFRIEKFLKKPNVFLEPCGSILIEPPYDFDADGPADFELAEIIIKQNLVHLPHLNLG